MARLVTPPQPWFGEANPTGQLQAESALRGSTPRADQRRLERGRADPVGQLLVPAKALEQGPNSSAARTHHQPPVLSQITATPFDPPPGGAGLLLDSIL